MADVMNFTGKDSIFATQLRTLMKEKKTTQQELAEAVGTTRQAVAQYADGSVQPNIEKLCKIASFFECDSDYLLGKRTHRDMQAEVKRLSDVSFAFEGIDENLSYEDLSTRKELLDIFGYFYDAFYDIRNSGLNVCNTFLWDMKELVVLIRTLCYNAEHVVAGIGLDLFDDDDKPLKLLAEFNATVQADKKRAEEVLELLTDRIIKQTCDVIETHISHLKGEEPLKNFIEEVKRIREESKRDGDHKTTNS